MQSDQQIQSMRSILPYSKHMKRLLGNSLLCLLMLWVAVGMPLIHPLFHHHDLKPAGYGRHFIDDENPASCGSFHADTGIQSPCGHHHGFCPVCHFFSHFGKFLLILAVAGLARLMLLGGIRLYVCFIFTPSCLRLPLPRGPPVFS